MEGIKAINEKFQRELKKQLNSLNNAASMKYWEEIIHPFILEGGKRIRPLLFLLSYQMFGGKLKPEVYNVAVALELLHHCALAHDDIIDKSSHRRGQPTLPQRYQKAMKGSIPPNLTGADYALVAGDILYTHSLGLIYDSNLEPDIIDAAVRLILRTALETTVGQYFEMTLSHHPEKVSRNQIDSIYEFKSAQYTFCCPLQLGTLMNWGSQKMMEIMESVGKDLGYSYQAQDDLNDFWTEIGDASINRITLPHFFLINKEKPADKKRICKILDNPPIGAEDMAWLKKRFEEKGVEALCQKEISICLKRAIEIFNVLPFKTEHRKSIFELLANIFPSASEMLIIESPLK